MAATWYLYCADAHSNEVVAQTLNGLQSTSEFKQHLCADGKKRELYEVPDYSFAARLWRSQKQLKAYLTVFVSEDGQKPREWKFPKKKKATLDKLKKESAAIKKGQNVLF